MAKNGPEKRGRELKYRSAPLVLGVVLFCFSFNVCFSLVFFRCFSSF